MFDQNFVSFVIRAKKATYASGIAPSHSSRPSSHDLHYSEDPYLYIDTYLGGVHFIGEEAVWKDGVNIWGMNYYGKLIAPEFPEGFSPFLKASLLQVPEEAPYRGPKVFTMGDFEFRCSWKGKLEFFEGEEDIFYKGTQVYHLVFHGGEIQN